MNLVTTCVGLPQRDVPALNKMQDDAIPVTYRTFRKRVGESLDEWAQAAGYVVKGPGLHLKDEWAVSFYRSKWKGKRCYFMTWSSIDHIFQ